jgi:hypothetical protein
VSAGVVGRAFSLIRFHEGTRYRSYRDTSKMVSVDGQRGLWTWGTGWCLETYRASQEERSVVREITGVSDIPFDRPLVLAKWLDALPREHAERVAAYMLRSYVLNSLPGIETNIGFWPDMDDNRAAAIVDMVYQMGLAGVLGFRITLGLLGQRRYLEAATELLRVTSPEDYAAVTPERAHHIAQIFASGEWPSYIAVPVEDENE